MTVPNCGKIIALGVQIRQVNEDFRYAKQKND